MSEVKRYHPILVTIHWITALLVLMMLAVGMLYLKWLPNDANKLMPLAIHMITGITILALTTIRIVVRFTTRKPAPATIGNKFLDFVGKVTHVILYLLLLGMGISGLGIALQAGLFDSVFKKVGTLPIDFYLFLPRIGHHYVAILLLLFVLLHLAAALYHQFIRKDHLLGRMSFRKG